MFGFLSGIEKPVYWAIPVVAVALGQYSRIDIKADRHKILEKQYEATAKLFLNPDLDPTQTLRHFLETSQKDAEYRTRYE